MHIHTKMIKKKMETFPLLGLVGVVIVPLISREIREDLSLHTLERLRSLSRHMMLLVGLSQMLTLSMHKNKSYVLTISLTKTLKMNFLTCKARKFSI